MLPLRRRSAEEMVLPFSPSYGTRRCEFSFSADSSCSRNDALRFQTQTSSAVVKCQPWFYRWLFAYRFFGLSERAQGCLRDCCPGHAAPNLSVQTHSRTRVSQEPDRPPVPRNSGNLALVTGEVESNSRIAHKHYLLARGPGPSPAPLGVERICSVFMFRRSVSIRVGYPAGLLIQARGWSWPHPLC